MMTKKKRTAEPQGTQAKTSRAEDDSPARSENESPANPLELATPVSAKVQIERVYLVSSTFKREVEFTAEPGRYRVSLNVSGVTHRIDPIKGGLAVLPSFSLVASGKDDTSPQTLLSIDASFVLEYKVDGINDFSQDQLEAFSWTNGVYNAWPYWREYVQNTSCRMGLPQIVIPVFRLP